MKKRVIQLKLQKQYDKLISLNSLSLATLLM